MSEPPSGIARVLSSVPAFRGIVWRGATFQLWGPMTLEAPLPTSRDPRVASENFIAPFLHAIVVSHGRDISALSPHPDEAEVILLPGAVLTPVTATCRVAGHAVQILREAAEDIEIVVPAHEDLKPIFASAHSAGPIRITSPRRFLSR